MNGRGKKIKIIKTHVMEECNKEKGKCKNERWKESMKESKKKVK
jgi:hypothetical protein